jgi:predicted metal-dependent hydrolase
LKAEKHCVRYGSHIIWFGVIRRHRRTLEIAVEPDASVQVTAPMGAAPDDINAKVRKRAAWILRQQRFFTQFLPRTPERRYLPGETHLYLGRQHRLKIERGEQEGVKVARGLLHVVTRQPANREVIASLVEDWYRERAHTKFAERLEVNLDRFADAGAYRPKGLIIRKIKQRWGSMSPAGRLLLNLRLIEAPTNAIDYVITHELCHMTEPNHGAKFFALLTQVLPDWRKRKERLERLMA